MTKSNVNGFLATALILGMAFSGCGFGVEVGDAPELETALAPTPSPAVAGGSIWTAPASDADSPVAGPAEPFEFPPVGEDRVLVSGLAFSDVVGFSEDGGRVAYFEQTGGMGANLFVADVHTGETRLVETDVIFALPHEPIMVAANGESILFRKTLSGGAGSWHTMSDLWAWRWETGQSTMLSKQVVASSYRMTPDGKTAIYVHTLSKTLYTVDLETFEKRELGSNVYAGSNIDPKQAFPVSADNQRVAWVSGVSGQRGTLSLANLNGPLGGATVFVAQDVVPRSAKFLGNLLEYSEGKPGDDTRVVQIDLLTGLATASGYGTGAVHSADDTRVAYLADSVGGSGELMVWDAASGEAVSVDSAVKHGRYAFSPSGDRVVYLRNVVEDTGELYVWNVEDGARTLVEPTAHALDGLPAWFAAGGAHLAYRAGACSAENALRLFDFQTGDSSQLVQGWSCGDLHPLPDGSGFLVMGIEPSRLLEVSIDGVVVELGRGPGDWEKSPTTGCTVHALQPLGGVMSLLVSNWESAEFLTIEGEEGVQLLSLTDTHLVYRRLGSPSALRMAALPK